MAIKLGNLDIESLYFGNNTVDKVCLGNVEIYSAAVPFFGLTFTANQANSTVGYTVTGTVDTSGIKYSRNGGSWTNWDGTAITLANAGDKIYVRNTNNTLSTSLNDYFAFTMTGSISASGDCNSMINYGTLSSHCFYNLFYNCTSLTTAPELPATTLNDNCYRSMFYNCTSLTTAPDLPATTLASYCYLYMFYNCTSLTSAPELPATTLQSSCYGGMFYGCTSLTSTPNLPVRTLVNQCYYAMFRGCTSLTTAPELPATIATFGCYSYMFRGCTSLASAPELPSTIAANMCYAQMFNGCTSLTTPPELPATTLDTKCYSSMFLGCTNLTSVPKLPATTLANKCYDYMFEGCTSLYVSDTQSSGAQYAWSIPSSGTFTNTSTYNQSTMFINCLGTRSSDNMSGAPGESHTYYTQNQPV